MLYALAATGALDVVMEVVFLVSPMAVSLSLAQPEAEIPAFDVRALVAQAQWRAGGCA